MTAITFLNGRLGEDIGSMRIEDARIAAVGCRAQRGDTVIDLRGARLYPGLINAHDHLPLNHLPPLETSARYQHVSDWIADVDTLRRGDSKFKSLIAAAREERLLMGAVKNLLSGVTSVAHHDPLYAELTSSEFPVRVLSRYGWSHSLYLDGASATRRSYLDTPSFWPWMIHAAEGINAEAEREFELLIELGCLKANTLLIHGIALTEPQLAQLAGLGAGLIWCPASNLRLFGATAKVQALLTLGRVALGSDSRLSGARDLLDELRIAKRFAGLGHATLESLVTGNSARLLRMPGRGELCAGAAADVLILPGHAGLGDARRADVRLLLKGGIVMYGDADLVQQAGAESGCARIEVDGQPKWLQLGVARRLTQSRLQEAGVTLPQAAEKAA